jgi:hypothetical protein
VKYAVHIPVRLLVAVIPVQGVVAPYADATLRFMQTMKLTVPDVTHWHCCDGWFLAKGDKAMFWLIAIFLFILLVAPIRRAFFSAWRFTLPAIAGFVFTIVMIRGVMKMNLPGLMVLGTSIFVAIEAGVIGLEIFSSGKRQ